MRVCVFLRSRMGLDFIYLLNYFHVQVVVNLEQVEEPETVSYTHLALPSRLTTMADRRPLIAVSYTHLK